MGRGAFTPGKHRGNGAGLCTGIAAPDQDGDR